ncbi:sensor histidine kinase [Catenulispora acidiphila]|uniref:sensor histidine kinase n=1 Tax=Catenulispora acidiphila TaxID=304895 RepID=UPI0002FD5E4D|nr:ATP-binding protein [Catenulispora acidiphila]
MTAGVEDGLHIERHVGAVLTAVAVTARAVALVSAVISLVVGLQERQFAHARLAVVAYVAVGLWSLIYLARARGGPPALWASTIDIAVLAAAMPALRVAGRPGYFDNVSNSALEPFVSAVLVGVAIHASTRRTLVACAVLGASYLATVTTHLSVVKVTNAGGDLAWLIGIALVCLVGARRLHRAAAAVGAGARSVVTEREQLAEDRGRDLERRRQLEGQRRRHLELHDGPLALLTAMSRPAPVGHPDARVRERCAANADLLRGLLSEEDDTGCESVPELRLGLVGAGADCAALGLRVRFQFGSLPAQVPEPVVEAMCGATRAALNNVLAHAGTRTAWVTVDAAADNAEAVTVDIVDCGSGFDPGTTAAGVGLPAAIGGRMAEVGGAAGVDSVPGNGTWVRLRWPA